MIEVHCSTHARLRFLYMVSALWLKPFESSALRERTTTKTELALGLFLLPPSRFIVLYILGISKILPTFVIPNFLHHERKPKIFRYSTATLCFRIVL